MTVSFICDKCKNEMKKGDLCRVELYNTFAAIKTERNVFHLCNDCKMYVFEKFNL